MHSYMIWTERKKHKKERRNKSKPNSNKLKRWTTKHRLDEPNQAATEICLHLMNVGTTQNLLYNSLHHTRSCVRIKGRRSGTVPSCTIRVKFLRIPLKLPRADVSGSSCKPAITSTFIMDTCRRARQTMTPFLRAYWLLTTARAGKVRMYRILRWPQNLKYFREIDTNASAPCTRHSRAFYSTYRQNGKS